MKTPEEIKKALECCGAGNRCATPCPFADDSSNIISCTNTLAREALFHIRKLECVLNRLGEFGKLFMYYEGCPRGAMGRAAMPIEEEVLAMKPITDVDGGRWIPVNADALHELVEKYKQMEEAIPLMKIQMHGDCGCCKHRNDERKLEDKQLGCRLSPACYECLRKDGRSQWEYEGLPEVKGKAGMAKMMLIDPREEKTHDC